MGENETLSHYGVKGMKWGVQKAPVTSTGTAGRTSGISGTRTPQPAFRGAAGGSSQPKLTKRQIAERNYRRKTVGIEVTKAVLFTAGTIGVSALAGPVVASGAAAVARTLMTQYMPTTAPPSYGEDPSRQRAM